MSESAVKAGKNGERSGVAAGRQKKSSFQITSVTATRMSNDGGDDSADDLDESHTDDISRVTEGENETPSFSEDTFSKDDVFFNPGSTSLGSAPVIPTSSQYGLAIVPTHDAPAPGPDAVDVINIGNVKTEASDPHVTTRNERFKVVKIESTEPFKRGRWQCMDYLDHSGYDEESHPGEQSIQISIPKPVPAQPQPSQTQSMSHTTVPNSAAVPQPQSMPHQQIQPSVQGQSQPPAASMPHSQPQNNGPVHQMQQQQQQQTPAMQVPNQMAQVPTMVQQPSQPQQQMPNMVPASQQPQQQMSNMVPVNQPQQQMTNMVNANQPQQQQLPSMVSANQQPQQQIPNMVSSSQAQQQMTNMVPANQQQMSASQPQQQIPNMVSGQPHPQQVMAPSQTQVPTMVSAPQTQVPNMVPGPGMVAANQQSASQVANIVPQNQQQIPTSAGQSQAPQMAMGSQSQPQSLTAMPQALQQAGQQQMQQQLMQQQLQQQMQYFPQAMQHGGGMMGMGHPMQQYPVQMPAGYGQPSYVPTMPQLLPQQMMQPNFQNFQQHPQQPTSSPSFPNSVTGSGAMGFSQGSQPVMSYTNQPQHPGMGYPQVMVPQMVPQVPQVPAEHASDLQVSVALLESLVEATASSEQVQANDDTESLFPSRLAQALAVYRERVSAARLAQAAPSRAPSPSPSASGTSAVAIDNKIEQAMDLVKSHLMFAVREEVEVLREKIAELMDRISLLEMENAVLKSQATPETLATLAAQVTASTKTPAPGTGSTN